MQHQSETPTLDCPGPIFLTQPVLFLKGIGDFLQPHTFEGFPPGPAVGAVPSFKIVEFSLPLLEFRSIQNPACTRIVGPFSIFINRQVIG